MIGDFFVREAHRGTRLASELLDRAHEEARQRGYGELALDVHVDNDGARAFYDKRGFEPHQIRMTRQVDPH